MRRHGLSLEIRGTQESQAGARLQALYERSKRLPVEMRPVRESDLPNLYQWSTAPDVARTWRYRGSTPSFPQFADHLFASTLALYSFARDGELVGIGNIYDASLAAGHAHLALLVRPGDRMSPVFLSCFFTISTYAFETWPLRKLYLECSGESVEQFQRAVEVGLLVEEARLVDYERSGRGTSDLIFLSFGRPTWMEIEP